jgi:hypothetical protein
LRSTFATYNLSEDFILPRANLLQGQKEASLQVSQTSQGLSLWPALQDPTLLLPFLLTKIQSTLNRVLPHTLMITVSSTKVQKTVWYPERHIYATHSEGPVNCHLHYLEPSLPYYANYHRWIRPQEPILGDSGHPIYLPVTSPTQELSFVNGNNITTYG